MAQEVEVKVKVQTGEASDNVNKLGDSFKKLDDNVKKTNEKTVDYGKQILNSGQLTSKLSQATGGLSDAFVGAVKGIDLTNLSLKGLKTAIMSTGVGLLVIALGELITIMADMFNSEKKSEQAVNDLTRSLDEQSKAFDRNAESAKFLQDINMQYAKANGESKDQLRKRNDQYLADEKKRIEEQIEAIMKLHYKTLENDDLTAEDRKKAFEKLDADLDKQLDLKQKNVRAKIKADADYYAEDKQAEKEATDKANEKKKADGEKAKQQRQQQLDALKNLEKKYADDLQNLQDKTEQQKLDRQKERALKELEAIKLSEKEKAKARQLIEADFKQKQIDLDKSHADKVLALQKKLEDDKATLMATTEDQKLALSQEKAMKQLEVDLANINATETEKENAKKLLKESFDIQNAEAKTKKEEAEREEEIAMVELKLEDEAVSFEDKKQLILDREALLLQDKTLTESQKLKIQKDSAEASKKIDEEQYKAKMALLSSTSQALSQASDVIGKETGVGKTLALASALMNTYQGISAGVKLGYPQAIPAVAMAALTGFGAVKNIMSVKVPKSSGSAGGGGGSMSTPPSAPPSINVVGASPTNAIAETIASQSQKPIKAFVVANDVTTQQGLDRNIVESATLG
jgi:hypothetical protein